MTNISCYFLGHKWIRLAMNEQVVPVTYVLWTFVGPREVTEFHRITMKCGRCGELF